MDALLPAFGPPMPLWDWFQAHEPSGAYDYFRGKYHEHLAQAPHGPALLELVRLGTREDITLLHHGSDPTHNTATALFEFLSKLAAYCPPEP